MKVKYQIFKLDKLSINNRDYTVLEKADLSFYSDESNRVEDYKNNFETEDEALKFIEENKNDLPHLYDSQVVIQKVYYN